MIKAAIAGYGSLGHMHADNLARAEGVRLACVCDIDPSRLTAPAEANNLNIESEQKFDISKANTYTDLDKMLSIEKPDLLWVVVPSYAHEEVTVAGLEAGANVFCEKPMSLTSAACRNMIAAARKSGKQLMTGQCIRFWPEYEYLQELIENKTYGSIKSLIMRRVGDYPLWSPWFTDHRLSGGAATDLHIHDLDWARWIFGEPDWFGATGAYGKTGGIDEANILMQCGETSVSVRGSWVSRASFDMSWEAYFEDATIFYRNSTNPSVKIVTKPGEETVPEIKASNPYMNELEYFVSVIRGERENTKCRPESALASIELLEKEIAMIKRNIGR